MAYIQRVLLVVLFIGSNFCYGQYMALDFSYASAAIPPSEGEGFNRTVSAILPLPDGRLLYGGDFEYYNGLPARGLACLRADGSLDTSFQFPRLSYARIDCLQRSPDGKILVGGNLNYYLGYDHEWRGIFRLLADGTFDTSFRPVPVRTVDYIRVEENGTLIVAGDFYRDRDDSQQAIRRLLPDGSVDPSFKCPIESVGFRSTILRIDQNTLLVTDCSNASSNGLLLINNDGSRQRNQRAFPGLQGAFDHAALLPDGTIVLAPRQLVEATPRSLLYKVNEDGIRDKSFSTSLIDSGWVSDIYTGPGGSIYIRGKIWCKGYKKPLFVARLDSAGNTDLRFRASPMVDDEVSALEFLNNGQLVLGYYGFSNNAPKNVHRLNSDGSLDFSYHNLQGPDGPVYAIANDAAGGLIAAGAFRRVNGREQSCLFRIRANGQPDTSFLPGGIEGKYVYTICNTGDGILVGGKITACSGRGLPGLMRLRGDGTFDTTFKAELPDSSQAYALLPLADGRIYVGGWFGTDKPGGLRRLLPDGRIDPTFDFGSGANGYVSALLLRSDGSLIAGGSFTKVNGRAAARVLRLDASGKIDTLFACEGGFDSTVNTLLALPDGSMMAGGDFRNFNGQRATALAKMNDAGWKLPFDTLPANWTGSVHSLLLQENAFRAGGQFRELVKDGYGEEDTYKYYPQLHFLRTGTMGHTQRSYGGTIVNLLPDGKGFWAAGTFTDGHQSYRRYLVRFDSNANSVSGLFCTPGLDKRVNVLVPGEDHKTYVAGAFQSVNGDVQPYFARLLQGGETDSSFHPDVPNGTVKGLVVLPDGKLMLYGDFTCIGSFASNGLARVDAKGHFDPTFNPGFASDGDISSVLALHNGKLLVAGRFDYFNRKAHRALARLLPDGRVDPSWRSNPCIDPREEDLLVLEQADGRILLNWRARCTEAPAPDMGAMLSQGDFISGIYRLLPDGSTDTSFHPALPHQSHTLAMQLLSDGRILLAGKEKYYPRVFRLMPDGSRDTSFHFVNEDEGFYSALALLPDGSFFASGTFTGYYRRTKKTGIRYFLKDGTRAERREHEPGMDQYDRINTMLWQNNALLFGGSFTSCQESAFNNLCRLFLRPQSK